VSRRGLVPIVLALLALGAGGCGVIPGGDKLQALQRWDGGFDITEEGSLMRLVADDWPASIAPVVAVCTGDPAAIFAEAPPDQVVMFDDPACRGSTAEAALDEAGSLVVSIDRDLLPERYQALDAWTLAIAYAERNGQFSMTTVVPAHVPGG
jgi:hypothetical protein